MKLVRPDLENRDFEFNDYLPNPDISKDVLQALVYLIAHDETNDIFRFVNVDSDGRVYVTSATVKSDTGNISRANIGIVASVIIDENPERQKMIIQNIGSETVYIGFDNTVDISTGFPIPAGTIWEDDTWLGSIYGICSVSGTELSIIEME